VIGIEILDANKVLAPGDWRTQARLLGEENGAVSVGQISEV
jgi:hypothetical protein